MKNIKIKQNKTKFIVYNSDSQIFDQINLQRDIDYI